MRVKERLRWDVQTSRLPGPASNLTVRKQSGAAFNWRRCDYLSDRDDIGNAISNEKPSLDRGWPGAAGSTTRAGSLATFAPDPVRLAIGSFVKAGASQSGRASEALGAALFGRICDLHTDLLGFYEIGSAMARTGLNPQDVRRRDAWHRIPCMIRFFSIFGGIRQ